jgi:hypothetical protein
MSTTRKLKIATVLGGAVLALGMLAIPATAAHADGPAGCIMTDSQGQEYVFPVGNEAIDGEYTVVVRDGKVYHRHKIYRCGQDMLWQDTGRYVDLEIGGQIGCCPSGGGRDPILP